MTENSKLNNENAKLSIQKQGDVVQVLSTMTSMLSEVFLHQRLHPSTFSSYFIQGTKEDEHREHPQAAAKEGAKSDANDPQDSASD